MKAILRTAVAVPGRRGALTEVEGETVALGVLSAEGMLVPWSNVLVCLPERFEGPSVVSMLLGSDKVPPLKITNLPPRYPGEWTGHTDPLLPDEDPHEPIPSTPAPAEEPPKRRKKRRR